MPLLGKILILVENLPVPFDRRVWLASTTLRDAGYQISVICPTGDRYPEGYECVDGVHVYRYELPPTGLGFADYVREYTVALVKTLRLSIWALRRHGFDAIHACNPPDLFFLIAWLYKPFRKKFIFDQHDLSPETYRVQRRGREGLVYRVLLLSERLTYATANMVIVTNETIRGIARRRGHVPNDKIFTVRSGPDLKGLKIGGKVPALEHDAKYLVCYAGVMGPQDGVDYGLRAAEWIVHSQGRQDVHFVFVGGGEVLPDLKHLADELGLQDHVSFTGWVAYDVLMSYVAAADVCMAPDPKNGLNECYTMNKTLEYMAMGKPQVAFDLVEARVSAGEAALYARPNDVEEFGRQVLTLLDDPTRREEMGVIGRERIEQELGWVHSQRKLLDAYEWLLGKKGS